jgi:hypothetical protein
MTALDTPTKAGTEFERAVASLYQLLGFNTTHNIELPGQQADIIATRKVPGLGEANLLVECKYLSEGSVTNQTVQNFLASYLSLKDDVKFTKAIMVTNSTYSKGARAIAQRRGDLELLTIPDLRRQLIDSSQAFLAYVNNYRQETIFNQYVRISAHGNLHSKQYPEAIDDLESTLFQWTQRSGSGFVTILGDYGSGKSTLLRKLKYDLLMSSDISPLPLLFELRMLNRFDNLTEYIRYVFLQNLNTSVSDEMFFYFANHGMFVFILDGFDEISSQFDDSVRAQAMLKLSPLLSTRSKTLLSCRPNYFMNIEEYNRLLENTHFHGRDPLDQIQRVPSAMAATRLQEALELRRRLVATYKGKLPAKKIQPVTAGTVVLKPFSEVQITDYLGRRQQDFIEAGIRENTKQIMEFLKSIYDISDLMTRPILLSMIADTISWGVIEITDKRTRISAAQLYETYTYTCFVRDYEKAPTPDSPTPDQRALFAELLAVAMLLQPGGGIPFSRVVEIAQEVNSKAGLETLNELNISRVAETMRYTTFLEDVGQGRFTFRHYSFVEFFSARWIKGQCLSGRALCEIPLFSDTLLKNEILYFLGSFAAEEPSLVWQWIQHVGELLDAKGREIGSTNHALSQRNALGALLFGDVGVRRRRIKGGHTWDVRAERIRLQEVSLEDSALTRVRLGFLTASAVRIRSTTLEACEFRSLTCEDCDWEFTASGTIFEGVMGSGCSFAIFGEKNSLQAMNLEESNLIIKGMVTLEGVIFQNVEMRIGLGNYRIDKSDFKHCRIFQARDHSPTGDIRVSLKKTNFRYCSIWGLAVSPNAFSLGEREELRAQMPERDARSVHRIPEVRRIWTDWLSGSKGLIFVQSGGLRGNFDTYKPEDLQKIRENELNRAEQIGWETAANDAMRVSGDGVIIADQSLFMSFPPYRQRVLENLKKYSDPIPDHVLQEFFV